MMSHFTPLLSITVERAAFIVWKGMKTVGWGFFATDQSVAPPTKFSAFVITFLSCFSFHHLFLLVFFGVFWGGFFVSYLHAFVYIKYSSSFSPKGTVVSQGVLRCQLSVLILFDIPWPLRKNVEMYFGFTLTKTSVYAKLTDKSSGSDE